MVAGLRRYCRKINDTDQLCEAIKENLTSTLHAERVNKFH